MSWVKKILTDRASRLEVIFLAVLILACFGWEATMGEPLLSVILGGR